MLLSFCYFFVLGVIVLLSVLLFRSLVFRFFYLYCSTVSCFLNCSFVLSRSTVLCIAPLFLFLLSLVRLLYTFNFLFLASDTTVAVRNSQKFPPKVSPCRWMDSHYRKAAGNRVDPQLHRKPPRTLNIRCTNKHGSTKLTQMNYYLCRACVGGMRGRCGRRNDPKGLLTRAGLKCWGWVSEYYRSLSNWL